MKTDCAADARFVCDKLVIRYFNMSIIVTKWVIQFAYDELKPAIIVTAILPILIYFKKPLLDITLHM